MTTLQPAGTIRDFDSATRVVNGVRLHYWLGGDTLDRSWTVLAPGGAIVSTAAPDVAARAPSGAGPDTRPARPCST